MSEKDFFGSEPEVQVKKKFGLLAFVVNNVKLASGASYSVAGILDRNQNLREFKGKQLVSSNATCAHVITVMRATNKDHKEYLMWRDCVTLGSDKAWLVLHKSLKAVFGAEYTKVIQPATTLKAANWLPCAIEEVATGEKFEGTTGEVEKTGWKVSDWFESEAAMREAESKYFARFGNSNGHGAGIPADVIAQAKQVYKLVNSDETFTQIVANDAKYSTYPIAELLAVAKA